MREPRLEFLFGEELLGWSRSPRREVVRVAIEQKLRCVDENLGGRFPGVDRNKFDPRALLVTQFDVHGLSLCCRVRGLSIELW